MRPVGAEWTESKGHPHPYLGYWSVFWGVTCEVRQRCFPVLDTNTVLDILRPLHLRVIHGTKACLLQSNTYLGENYKLKFAQIMLWLAIIDIIAILCNSIGFGLFMIEGTVFCSRPWSVWLVGCVGLGTVDLSIAFFMVCLP